MTVKLYILSKHADHSFTRIIGARDDHGKSDAGYIDAIKTNAAAKFGGAPINYAVLSTTDATAIARQSEGLDVTWTTEGQPPVITYATADAKARLTATASAAGVRADGTATVTVTFTARRVGDDSVFAGLSGSEFVRVANPDGVSIPLRVTFAAGVASVAFKTTAPGDWVFPAPGFTDPRLAPTRPADYATVAAFLTEF